MGGGGAEGDTSTQEIVVHLRVEEQRGYISTQEMVVHLGAG